MAKLSTTSVNGDLTVTGKVTSTVAGATTSTIGTVKLNNATNSTSTTEAATAAAVKAAYDKGNHSHPYAPTSHTHTKSQITDFAHGNHVPGTQTANNAIFLRNDNTWQTVTPANIGAATSGHTHNQIFYADTRAVNYNPNTASSEFKTTFQQNNTNGVSDGGGYYTLMHIPRYSHNSGGFGNQMAFTDNNNVFVRRGTSDTAWGSWYKIYHSGAKPTLSELGAAASNHGHSNATSSAHGFMSNTDKGKLDGIATGANKYSHPNDANTRHVTDSEKGNWNGAVTKANDWNSFKTNGGTIAGDCVSLTKGRIYTKGDYSSLELQKGDGTKRIRFQHGSDNGNYLNLDFGVGETDSKTLTFHKDYIVSNNYGKATIGTINEPFKDIYLNGRSFNSNGSGWTKLANGIIIQWGQFSTELFENGTCWGQNITYWTKFPTMNIAAWGVMEAIQHGDGGGGPWKASSFGSVVAYANTVNGCSLYANNFGRISLSTGGTAKVRWVAIGY